MTYFVIMGNATDYCEVMCREIIGRKNVTFINKANNLKSDLAQSLDLLFQKISSKTNISFFPSFRFKSYFCDALIPKKNNLCFIFFDSNAHSRDKAFLKYIKNEYKAKLVLYVINPTSAIELKPEFCSDYYDLVFTVYANDADHYGWNISNHIYSKIPEIKQSSSGGYDNDVFFIGRAKNRLHKILHVYKFLVSHDIKCDFFIIDADEKEKRYANDIHYAKWLPYKEALKRMCRSRCVLEIIQKPGEGPTLRTTEAIIYNKKLITNDAGAAANPFYDDRFVHIFNMPENIDLDFIKKDIESCYNCDEEYSANNFLKRIEEMLFSGQVANL